MPSDIETGELFLDKLKHARVAEKALAEIERGEIPQHKPEALIGRLVEAELLLQALDEFRIEALRAAIFRADVAARGALPLRACAKVATLRP